jgi:hypothetical protein
MHEDVCRQQLGDCELDKLLDQPTPDRTTARLNPDVRSKTNLQRVNTVDPEREHLLLGHDGRPVALEVTEQGEVAAVDDDPMLE